MVSLAVVTDWLRENAKSYSRYVEMPGEDFCTLDVEEMIEDLVSYFTGEEMSGVPDEEMGWRG
ncbi:MAG: hypothetical protein ABSC64_02130 [Candidatus Korobacteraceae bacterium]